MVSEITTSDILDHLRVDSITNYSYGARVTLTTVSSLRNNREFRTELKAESPSESNHRNRIRDITQIVAKVQEDLQTIGRESVGTSHSHVFYSLFTQLEQLSGCSECSQKTILFISDLQQHSPDEFSALRRADWSLLTANPEEIELHLDSIYPLNPELVTGIRVIFAHRPTTMVDDGRFYVMANFLKSYLSKKGIIVETRTSFN